MNTALMLSAALIVLLMPVVMVLADPPREGWPVLVVVPPWQDSVAIVQQTGGRVVGPIAGSFAILAVGDGADFATRLRKEGAWAVRDAQPVLRLCGVET